MASKYDENGMFLGEIVENLTDGPTEELRGEPYGTLGKICPAQGESEFSNMVWNLRPFYSRRRVWHREHGSVRQALVDCIGGLQWINIR